MTLYHLIKRFRGKETIAMTDQLRKVNNYKKRMEDSQRKGVKGQRVEYKIVKAEEDENEKFKMKPHNLNLSGQPRRPGPPRIQK